MIGDEAAAELLAHQAMEPLYRFCLYRVGGRRELCEDVVQETLVRAIRDIHKYEPLRAEGDIFPWLTGLARNEIRRALAQLATQSKVQGARSLDHLWTRIDQELLHIYSRLDDAPLEEAQIDREETRQMVGATMAQLPNRYRAALEAKYVQGQSVRDIAEAGGESEKAVESLLTRARLAFRETFLAIARNVSVDDREMA
ncbi:MAG: sigma-70 family RNA polymerase sigma factor [Phycisphaeraceae bacterium]